MKFVIAPDKFKGSLTGIEFCDAVEQGIKSVLPQAEITKLPLADGGDGTLDILNYHLKGKRITLPIQDPLFRPIMASYLWIQSSKTAFIEMAQASGMNLLTPVEQNCFYTTSYGTGELIKDAIIKGAKTIVLGIGGSATNDCGIGMATAMGFKFLNKKGEEIEPIGKNLSSIIDIDASSIMNNLNTTSVKIACDVTNPLYGEKGAAFVYGPQKGANSKEIELLDRGLEHFAKLLLNEFNTDVQKIKGSGAAGGMGAAGITFLNAKLLSGIDLIKDLVYFDNKIKNADWVITGEGKLDSQTLSGKTIQGVIDSAKKQQVPVAAFCGNILLSDKEIKKMGLAYANSIMEKAIDLQDAMGNSRGYLKILASEFIKKIY